MHSGNSTSVICSVRTMMLGEGKLPGRLIMTFQRVLVFKMHVTLFELCDLFAYAWGLSERQTIKEGTVEYG